MDRQTVGKQILSANERFAAANAELLAEHNLTCLNMISSPGSGKTTILAKTITDIRDKLRIGVIEGDLRTDLDAQRIRATHAPAIQIETEGACHLSAQQVNAALKQLPLADLDMVIIENVGNLVCPSAFALGETDKIVVLSVAEGDDKPAKYPFIFAKSAALLINKIDLLAAEGLSDFNVDRVKTDASRLNKTIDIFPIAARTGEAMQPWYDWLIARANIG